VIALSSIDEARFGIRTAKATDLTVDSLPDAIGFCRREAVRFLITRCSASDLPLVHQLEQDGFLLMDTLVYYRHRNLAHTTVVADPEGVAIRPVEPAEAPLVRSIAAQSFQGYKGHYHADPRLNPNDCDEAYQDWAVRSCESREPGQSEVLVAASPDGLLGFATLRMKTPDEGDGVLFAVAPTARRRGICRLLLQRAMEWSRAHGAKSMSYSTQATNLAVQKVLVRLGFEPCEFSYTFHRWFD
jgi:ribosomal protein S18 acetylase RimI-like enzyme